MGKFPLLFAVLLPKSGKKFLEQLSAYMLCCFRNYTSTLVICKVVAKVENGHIKFKS